MRVSDAELYAGPERTTLIRKILERLLRPTSLEYMLKRIPCDHSQSEEEQLLFKFVKLLHLLDIPVTAETVQGSGSYKERATFLHSLVQLVTATQELLQPSETANPHSPQASPNPSHSQSHTHSYGGDMQASASQSQPQPPLGREMRVLELACERVGVLTQESAQLLPVHVTQALQPLLPHVSTSTSQWAEWSQQVQQQNLPVLQQQQTMLESQVNLLGDEEWTRQHSQSVAALSEFLSSSHSFHRTYQQELQVWCQSQEPAQTFGLGQQASELLHRYSQVSTLLTGLAQLRKTHDTLHRCAPPLEGLQTAGLQRLLLAGQQELQRLQSMVGVLETSNIYNRRQQQL